ncbi:MAG: bifunctional 3-deoxy-7-phosphoheptulonate synthase/chorismate mutase [Candidatus Xenobium sp.]
MSDESLEQLRAEIDSLNLELLHLLNRRAELALQIGQRKAELGLAAFDPTRESAMLEQILENNRGPFPDAAIQSLFKEVFKASLDLMNKRHRQSLLVSRWCRRDNTVVEVGGVRLGADLGVLIAGPCSVEGVEQLEEVAAHLARRGVRLIRGGAFKPRTSPYSFQGLGQQALTMLSQVARRHGLAVVTEVLDPRDLEVVLECADVLQIGARNMFNYPLLQEVGRTRTPILLKRSFQATLEELLLSAEHVMSQGNDQVILCERGIRTFERWTRSTLDISAVPLLKQESHLPVVVDVSHAAGRRDILAPLARAALAAGADGLMLEVHSNPAVALSDGEQQLDLPGFDRLLESLGLPGPG